MKYANLPILPNNLSKGGAIALETEKLLDSIGWQILQELQQDARLSFAELARRVSLSTPSVIERVHRLEEVGIISGYHAAVDLAKVGLPINALMQLAVWSDADFQIAEVLAQTPEVFECHRVTGENCYVCKVSVSSIKHLEELISRLSRYGRPTTSLILSSPVIRRVVEPNSTRAS